MTGSTTYAEVDYVQRGYGHRTFRTTSHNEKDIAGFLDEDTNFVRFCGLIGTIRGYVARTHGHNRISIPPLLEQPWQV